MLNQSQTDQFDQEGYLVIDDVLDDHDRKSLICEYAELVDQVAEQRGHSAGDWHRLDFEQKLTRLIVRDPDAYEQLDITLPLREGLDETAGIHTGPAVFDLLTHPRILDIAESIIGPEIYSNPVQHVRIKPPESSLSVAGRGNSNMARTGWHQDAAVIVEEADSTPLLTVWVAVTDATPEMGCMRAIPGSHHWKSLGMHCPGKSGAGEIYIPDEMTNQHKPINLEVKAGGVVLLHKQTWHGAGPNQSNRIRWSFDLRFQPPGYNTGRDCFPGFLARSAAEPDKVLTSSAAWTALWNDARTEIASGTRNAVFNNRWQRFRDNPLCA